MQVQGAVVLQPNWPGIRRSLRQGRFPQLLVPTLWRSIKDRIARMGAASDYLEDAWLKTLKGTAFSIASGNFHVALYTAAPGETGGGTEVSGGSYARQPITAANLSAVVAGEPSYIENTPVVQFPTATADWNSIAAAGARDALTAGNLLYFGALQTAKTVLNGDSFKFNAGDFEVGIG